MSIFVGLKKKMETIPNYIPTTSLAAVNDTFLRQTVMWDSK